MAIDAHADALREATQAANRHAFWMMIATWALVLATGGLRYITWVRAVG